MGISWLNFQSSLLFPTFQNWFCRSILPTWAIWGRIWPRSISLTSWSFGSNQIVSSIAAKNNLSTTGNSIYCSCILSSARSFPICQIRNFLANSLTTREYHHCLRTNSFLTYERMAQMADSKLHLIGKCSLVRLYFCWLDSTEGCRWKCKLYWKAELSLQPSL